MIDTVSGTGMQTRADSICEGSQSSFVGEEFNLGQMDLVVGEGSLLRRAVKHLCGSTTKYS